ncbi:phosphate transport system substrate-binding protein [Siphonobacter sp. SORGH_AS 1065]|nr:phosphate transport system substrate-binding protein [Siphonobacter sp. SORGH_AS_1065]
MAKKSKRTIVYLIVMKTVKSYLAQSLLLMTVALAACQSGDKQSEETVSRGEITISVDESLKPIIQAETEAFEAKTKYAKVNTVYVPELAAIQLMLKDSTRLAVVTRHLKPDEKEVFEKANLKYRALHMATDAIAFITHGSSKDTLISVEELKEVMHGKITKWNQLKYGKSNSKITLVLDNDNSSNLQYLLDTLQIADKKQSPLFAVKSNKEVIEYVQKTPGAVGVIGVNWISDIDDPEHPTFTKGIKVMGVAPKYSANLEDYIQPYQYAIALKKYPLSRNIYLITKEAKRGLGTGFINYVLSDPGQRIVLKSGLLPATQVIRLIETRNF